jgi:TPR repeat protein
MAGRLLRSWAPGCILWVLIGPLCVAQAHGAAPALDSRAFVERSVTLIEAGSYELARSYLEPALIDYRLSAGERARAYYLRGYSFYAQRFWVSAGKDYGRALEFNPDNPAALAALAGLHARGLGVARDETLAYGLFLKAAEAGHVDAQFHLGHAQLEGLGTQKNVDGARTWLKLAADRGHLPAMTYMARSFRTGATDFPDPEQARAWYQKAFDAGAVDALVALAFMHQNGELRGESGEPNSARAAELFAQAAQAGSAAGQVSLAHLYLTGESRTRDYPKALSLFRQAAAQNIPAAFLGLGHLFEAGLGVEADLGAAEDWYRRAANSDLLNAQLRLASLLLSKGSLQASTEAMGWLARAAEHDNPQAYNDYAWMLATHPQSELRDSARAVALARRAVATAPSAAYLDTLAAAYAEAGEFEHAVTTQRDAIAALQPTEEALRAELNAHLDAFQQGKPWRE